jgi:DNA-binding NtrC family response regulator
MPALDILRREAPLVPLIVVTGSIDEETAAACIKVGETGLSFLQKPFRPDALVRKVWEVLKRHT